MNPQNHFYDSNGLRLHYVSWGDPALPTVIVHHGFLDQCRSWDRAARLMADRFHIVVLDARGHGDSDWIGAGGSYYFPDYLFDLRALYDHLGAEPVFLLGHSMGGAAVSYFAGSYPDAARAMLVVEGLGPPPIPSTGIPQHVRIFVSTLRQQIEKRDPAPMLDLSAAVERMRRADPLMTEETAFEIAEHATKHHPLGGLVWKFDPLHRARMGTPFVPEHALALWRNVSVPVLHLIGEKSRFPIPDRDVRSAAFSDFRETTIAGAGHNLHAHAPEAVAKAAEDFFGKHL